MKSIFFVSVLFYSIQSIASWCELNVAPAGTEVTEDKKSSFIKSILYDFEKGGVGKRLEIGDIEALIWSKGDFAYLKIIDHKTKNSAQGQFDPKQSEMLLSLSPNYDLKCIAKVPDQVVAEKKAQFDSDTFLTDLPSKLELVLKREFTIYFSAASTGSRMEGQYWQGGKKVSRLSIDKSADWCFWQTQIRVDDDVDFKPGLRIPVVQNQFKDKVLSLSFVDFEQAKVVYKTSRYAPFQMECYFRKENANLSNWQDIVGADWELVKK